MFSVEDQKDSTREIVAQIRVAADALNRAAECLQNWQIVEDDPEVQELRSSIEGLVHGLAKAATVLSTADYEQAREESRVLKFMCDGVADLRPIGRLKAGLIARWKAPKREPHER